MEFSSYYYFFSADQTPSNTAFQGVGTHTLTGFRLKMQQFYALLLKRFHHARRNFKGVISQILLPAIFIAIAMTMALSFPKSPDQPPWNCLRPCSRGQTTFHLETKQKESTSWLRDWTKH